jgi:branched-chain amino acid transport system permease protein
MGTDGRKNAGKGLMNNPPTIDPALKAFRSGRTLFWAAGLLIAALAPVLMPNPYWLRVFSLTGVYVMLALGLNVVAGFAGLLDLAYVAFFGIGGYLFALLSSNQLNIHLPFMLVLPLSALLAAGIGILLGSTSIRLRGDYLAIVTLAFAQIFKLLLLNLDQPVNLTGGVNGIYNFDPIRILGFPIASPQAYARLIWLAALLTAAGCFRLKDSRYGRGWQALREDELAAETAGVNTVRMKLSAFAAGAFVAGGAGAIFASFQDSVFPNNFDFPQLVIVYCMVILGGIGSIPGVAAGAVVLSVLPEFLREYGAYRMMLYGLTLIVLMALRPEGLFGQNLLFGRRRKRPDFDAGDTLKGPETLYAPVSPGGTDAFPAGRPPGRCERVILELSGLKKNFGGLQVIQDLSLQLHEYEILSIIGPNGAGKTTLFNLISGVYRPDQGKILFEGQDIGGLKPHRITRLGIARTFQNLRVFSAMSVIENIAVGRFCRTLAGFPSILLHLPRHSREEAETFLSAGRTAALFGSRLTGYRSAQPAAFLSYANRRRLEIGRALATEPRILLLDEPSAGMNPRETEEITDFIRMLRDACGYTILVIEHKLDVVRSISDRVIVLDYGRKVAEGSYQRVSADPQVIQAYLGRKRR